MPGVDYAFTLSRHDEHPKGYHPTSNECKDVKATSGKEMRPKPSTSRPQTVHDKEVNKIHDLSIDLSPQAENKDRKLKLISTTQNNRKACKLRPTSLISPCKKHGQHPEHENTVSKQKSLHICTSCSSNEVIEVNIKLKSCQNCQNVIIDEINYDNQPVAGNELEVEKTKAGNSSNTDTPGTSGLNFYHQQLTIITKKIKNMYKNRIHSSHTDEQQPSHSQNSGNIQQPASKPVASSPIEKIPDPVTSPCPTSSTKAASSATRRPVRIVAPQNPSSNFNNSVHTNNNHCYSNKLPTDDNSEYSTSKISSISILPLNSSSNNSNVINKDALILRICDLDDKLKSVRNDSKMNDSNADSQKLSTDVTKQIVKNSCKTSPTPILLSQPNTRKIVIISDEYKRKSERNDVLIHDRRELIKRFQQNKSKSLDLLPPSKASVKPQIEEIQAFSSQSVTNLSKQASVDGRSGRKYDINDDDDDGPYESINSVELIFISDEFLNKAVKHDLKILKSKQTATKNDPIRLGSLKKKKTRMSEASTSPIKMLKPDDCCSDNQQSPSSVSPENVQSSGKKSTSNRQSSTSSKKLIVISEDFKRKSLENNVVIVDNCTNDSNILAEVADKRKTFQQTRKLSRQQSSIDDVANQMVSHAFRSFEEPDEQCLESKEIKTPE